MWYHEWPELIARLELLDQRYRTGVMTAARQERYRCLLDRLPAAIPDLRHLELPLPTIPLRVYRAAAGRNPRRP